MDQISLYFLSDKVHLIKKKLRQKFLTQVIQHKNSSQYKGEPEAKHNMRTIKTAYRMQGFRARNITRKWEIRRNSCVDCTAGVGSGWCQLEL